MYIYIYIYIYIIYIHIYIYIYNSYINELDKSCFQYDMAYGDFKDLSERIFSDKVVRD